MCVVNQIVKLFHCIVFVCVLFSDDIIKLNKKETANQKRGRGQTQGRGRGRKIVQGGGHGRGVASQQSARGGGGKPGGLAKKQWNTRSKGAQQVS